MTRVRLVSLLVVAMALPAACILNPQPIPPEDLAAAPDASEKSRDAAMVQGVGDAAAPDSTDPSTLDAAVLDAAVLDASTDASTDASDDGG